MTSGMVTYPEFGAESTLIQINDLDDNVVNIVSTLANDMQIGLEEHKLNAHNIFSQIKGL